jgi:hypothetical protein
MDLPGVNLDHCSVNDLSRQGINNTTARVVGIIRRNERLGFVAHNTGQGTRLTSLFQSCIDFFLRNWRFDFKDTVGQTGIEQWDTNGEAVELAFEFWVDLDNGCGTTGGSGAKVLYIKEEKQGRVSEMDTNL